MEQYILKLMGPRLANPSQDQWLEFIYDGLNTLLSETASSTVKSYYGEG